MRHTISVLFEQNLNAVSRIIGLFTGRGFRIDTVSFGDAGDRGLSRLTLTTKGDDNVVEQITKHLNKLVDVHEVEDLTNKAFIERELALVKVTATQENKLEIIQMMNIFRGNVIDISKTTLTIELTGKEDKINAAIEMLEPYGLLQVARTGGVALPREFQSKSN